MTRYVPRDARLPRAHPTGVVFLDETGAIANDRFFGVGIVKLAEPSRLLRAIQKIRDQQHWYKEFKFSELTKDTLPVYKSLVDECLATDGFEFFCFVADRTVADPIERFQDAWTAYGKMAEQLVLAIIRPPELVSVVADNYSTPDTVLFEEDLKSSVNRRARRLAVTSVVRMDSKSSDGLQIVDLFTSATAFEFRADAGIASKASPKALLSEYIRQQLGCASFLSGWRSDNHSVQLYSHGSWKIETNVVVATTSTIS